MSSQAPPSLQRTPLFERHRTAGAKLVDFAGWEMPVSYPAPRAAAGPSDPIVREHMAVREACGIFDVSHMGQIETSGPHATELLQRLLSNDLALMPIGGAQYSVLCREDGGVLDDLFTYRLDGDRYLTVTNAANHARDLAWFQEHALQFPDARVDDAIERWAMLAVQGPLAREIVQALSDDRSRVTRASGAGRFGDASAASVAPIGPRFGQLPARMHAATRRLGGAQALVCGTGYTGEDGVEVLCAPEDASALWDELVRRGATPAGLAARDTLRLEACFHLYGNDLSTGRGPIEAGLGWCCKEDTGFIGSEAVRAVRAAGPAQRLVAFAIDGPGIARKGNPIAGGGEVTSGTLSPCLQCGIGLAYVPAERSAAGTRLQVDVRGKMRCAVVKDKPLYRKGS